MCENPGKKITGFTFNSKTAKCERFATIGCKLSENGFKSKEMCQACEKGDYYRNVKSKNANQYFILLHHLTIAPQNLYSFQIIFRNSESRV